jgi:hypothetical protein
MTCVTDSLEVEDTGEVNEENAPMPKTNDFGHILLHGLY